MEAKNSIDFLIIGAQKAGTTSLFKYLTIHPEIFMPAGKEINFFSDNAKFIRGINWYLSEHFAYRERSKIKGEASPDYMKYDYVAMRIHSLFPRIKLIAILRNPIMRTYSHYRMSLARKIETRPFEVCIKELLNKEIKIDNKENMEREFIRLSEYGRILSIYLRFFPQESIKIMFSEKLREDPVNSMKSVYEFLGVSNDIISNELFKEHNVGGDKRYRLLEKVLMSEKIRKPLRLVIPSNWRKKIGFWFITEFTVKPKSDPGPNSNIRKQLTDHFRRDVSLLENLFGLKVPWEEFAL